MAFFYSTPPVTASYASSRVVANVVKEALSTTPQTTQDAERIAAQMAAQITQATPPQQPSPREFRWPRIVAAAVVLMLMFFAGIYCTRDPQLQDWSKLLLHGFEILLGGVVGLLIGESTGK